MRLIIRSDANFKIGFGHMMRCIALAQYWRQHVGHVSFVCHTPIPELIAKRLAQEPFDLRFLSTRPGSEEDAHQLIEYAHSFQASAVVMDGYHFNETYQRTLFESPFYTLVIDDYAHLNSYWADGLLNQAPEISTDHYRDTIQEKDCLLGPNFALLRQEIIAQSVESKAVNTKTLDASTIRLLITLGGTQPRGLIEKVLGALNRLSLEHRLKVKLLAPASDLPTLPIWVQPISYTDDMATLYRWADLAICGGGGTQWEMSFYGIPRLAIILADNQLPTTRFLHQRNCCINAGSVENLTTEILTEKLGHLFSSPETQIAMRKNNRSLIDGQGARRVCEFIRDRIPCKV